MDPQEPEDPARNASQSSGGDSDPGRYRYEFPDSSSDRGDRNNLRYYNSANGGTILTLGVLSLLCCGIILGPIAWIMGNMSLSQIYQGEADPSETSSVVAGRALGIIGTLGHGLFLCLFILGHVFGDQSAPYYQYLPYHN